MKHSSKPLPEQLKSLYYHFRLLRQNPAFKRYVTGGVWFLQTHIAKSDGLWHNHLHCIVSGKWIPANLLKALWLDYTQGSHVVNLKLVDDLDQAAEHVARYATTPCEPTKLTRTSLTYLMQCLNHRRICGTWGVAKTINLHVQTPADAKDYVKVATWKDVMEAPLGDSPLRALLHAYKTNTPLSPEWLAFFTTPFDDKKFIRKRHALDPYLEFIARDNIF